MKAAVMRAVNEPLQIEEVAISKPGPHEVLIRAAATGVCHSDLHFVEGHYPTPLPSVLGHECAGVVEQVGSEVRTVNPGDHVVTCLSAFCGHCEFCVGGHLSLCNEPDTQREKDADPRLGNREQPMGQFLNLSAFAEQLLVHENACVAIRKDMPLDRAALLGCATITAYGSVVRTAEVRPGQSVAVIGCGGVGLATINAAQIAGAGRIIAIDRVAGKEQLARDFGATDFIDASEGEVWKKVLGLTGGGVDHAFEAIGLAETAGDAFRMLRRRGIATVIGMIPVGQKISLNGYELLQEKQLRGSMMGSNQFPVDIPRLVDFYMDGRLKLDELISRRIDLAQVNEAFDEMKTGTIARSVITFD
ncbi:Zn-dependent alcohol dehydrogenase [Aurantiacibacter spongiae]|uniref:Zn-dependent alcohol dehydrogenase n=1 Tax=Aurantiacibacter spongiae TaxID=2488860 RepID=A0A3N5DNW0_9SPHN|nr:Zn-dependent alcohol dehydrogenase [Aurantiacibacter spongiae]RPF70771.1 Zn-dependent alcohol dehydrogenase [Aurantiacibacter spongiae]